MRVARRARSNGRNSSISPSRLKMSPSFYFYTLATSALCAVHCASQSLPLHCCCCYALHFYHQIFIFFTKLVLFCLASEKKCGTQCVLYVYIKYVYACLRVGFSVQQSARADRDPLFTFVCALAHKIAARASRAKFPSQSFPQVPLSYVHTRACAHVCITHV